MSTVHLELTPHDPLVARDGRPFGVGSGNRMRGLPWLLPSVVAGSFRTALVKALGRDFAGDMPERLKRLAVAGVFPVCDGKLHLPAPDDALLAPDAQVPHRLIPRKIAGGCDWPGGSELLPVVLPVSEDDFKPAEVPAWWPVDRLARWLLGDEVTFDRHFLGNPKQENRDHVALDAERGAALDGLLFSTSGLNLTRMPRYGEPKGWAETTLTARVTLTGEFDSVPAFWHPLGGERRLIHWQPGVTGEGWACPPQLRDRLSGARYVRMVLATPAIFTHGWRPAWLVGGVAGVKLKLVGATLDRWRAVSGWSLAAPRGPKAIRRMVPAGAVYFFEVVEGDPAALAERWLQSVCDDEQEQRDGFGLAVWGIWQPEGEGK